MSPSFGKGAIRCHETLYHRRDQFGRLNGRRRCSVARQDFCVAFEIPEDCRWQLDAEPYRLVVFERSKLEFRHRVPFCP